MRPTQNLHVKELTRLLTPRALKTELPASEATNETVATSRERIQNILRQEDPRLLVVVGPCSIHDIKGRAGLRHPAEPAPERSGRRRWKS